MTKREEVLEYGLSFSDVYTDMPFHDDNWVLLRCRKNKRAFAWTYERNGHIWVNVKVDLEWREFWRNTYSSVLKIIESSIVNCEKVRLKLKEGSSSFSLNTNRLNALYISKALLTEQENEYTKNELEKAVIQITSIKNKSTTGINNAKEGSGTYTRFSRLINAMDIILEYLQNALKNNKMN